MTAHDAAAARADYCRLLAACFWQPEGAFAEERVFDAMAGAGRLLGAAFAADATALGDAFAHADPQALLVDYTRLFIGPADKLASPYESAWLGRDGATPVLPVLKAYADGDFTVDDAFGDLPDHVAAELEFLYLLLFREAEALARGDGDALARWQDRRHRFLGAHLGRWIAPFAAAMRTGAQSAFYRRLADAAERWVQEEQARGPCRPWASR